MGWGNSTELWVKGEQIKGDLSATIIHYYKLITEIMLCKSVGKVTVQLVVGFKKLILEAVRETQREGAVEQGRV